MATIHHLDTVKIRADGYLGPKGMGPQPPKDVIGFLTWEFISDSDEHGRLFVVEVQKKTYSPIVLMITPVPTDHPEIKGDDVVVMRGGLGDNYLKHEYDNLFGANSKLSASKFTTPTLANCKFLDPHTNAPKTSPLSEGETYIIYVSDINMYWAIYFDPVNSKPQDDYFTQPTIYLTYELQEAAFFQLTLAS